jgi:superfamily II DNA helicase RecQ
MCSTNNTSETNETSRLVSDEKHEETNPTADVFQQYMEQTKQQENQQKQNQFTKPIDMVDEEPAIDTTLHQGETPQTKKRRLTIEHERKTCIMIQGIQNPKTYKNPLLLQNEVKKIFPRATRARVLRYGDIKIWFKKEDEARTNAEGYNQLETKTFGKNTSATKWKKNDDKYVVHKVSATMTSKNITDHWKENNLNIEITKEVLRANNKEWKTLFVKPKDDNSMEELDKGKIKNGFAIY